MGRIRKWSGLQKWVELASFFFFFFLMRMGLDKANGLPHEIGSMEANKIVTT